MLLISVLGAQNVGVVVWSPQLISFPSGSLQADKIILL
jgi:hypothetical protein